MTISHEGQSEKEDVILKETQNSSCWDKCYVILFEVFFCSAFFSLLVAFLVSI